MKTLILCMAWMLGLAASVLGDSLKMDQVAADAKWLVHLDVDYLLKTRLGSFFFQDIVNKEYGEQRAELRDKLGVDLDLGKINSVTAYGTSYNLDSNPKGVLLLNTELNPGQLLDTLVLTFGGKEGDASSALRKIRSGDTPLYVVKNDLFLSPLDNHRLLVGKSREEMTKAQAVLAGKAPSLKNSNIFRGFPPLPEAFFIVATTGPIPSSKEDAARKSREAKQFGFLQMANGGRVALGESKGNLVANISLRAADPDASRQMQQVVQGMIALISLSNSGDPMLRKLAQSARINEENDIVTLGVELPTGDVIGKIRDSDLKIEIDNKKESKHKKPASKQRQGAVEKADKPSAGSEDKENN